MKEYSSGIIIFRHASVGKLYLLLHYSYRGDYWDFPRGNIKNNENAKQAAIRETKEETGLSEENLGLVNGFKEVSRWSYRSRGDTIYKQVTYFLAETSKTEVKISKEHIGSKWLNFHDALRLLRYKNSKDLLIKAEKFIETLN